jgi:hypothetical protein
VYVPVPVPEPCVPAVFRLVTDWLLEVGEDMGVAGWDEAIGDSDSDGVGYYWWQALRPDERRLLCLLADTGVPTPAADAASALGLSPSDLAGILGPLQRRAHQEGRPVPVRSRLTTASDGTRRRIKVLSLAEGVADIVAMYRDDQPASDHPGTPAPGGTARKAVVRRRARAPYAP